MWFFLKVLYFLKMHWAIIRWVKPLRIHKAHHKSILFWWLRVAVLSYIYRVLRTVNFFCGLGILSAICNPIIVWIEVRSSVLLTFVIFIFFFFHNFSVSPSLWYSYWLTSCRPSYHFLIVYSFLICLSCSNIYHYWYFQTHVNSCRCIDKR